MKFNKYLIEIGYYVDGHIWETEEKVFRAPTKEDAKYKAGVYCKARETSEKLVHPKHEHMCMIESIGEIKED